MAERAAVRRPGVAEHPCAAVPWAVIKRVNSPTQLLLYHRSLRNPELPPEVIASLHHEAARRYGKFEVTWRVDPREVDFLESASDGFDGIRDDSTQLESRPFLHAEPPVSDKMEDVAIEDGTESREAAEANRDELFGEADGDGLFGSEPEDEKQG